MKNYIIFVFTFLFLGTGCYAQVGINSTNTPPNSSAMLDVSSTNKGVLIPRMNTAQKVAIPNKTEGLMVYDSDVKQFSYWTGTLWVNFGNSVSAGVGWSQSGSEITNTNTGVVKINSPSNIATNAIFGSNGAGISLQKGNPVIGFNQYRDANNAQRYMADGHAMSLLVSPYWGSMIWNANSSGFAGSLTSQETPLMILSNSGRLGIGVGDDTPQEKLTIGTSPNSYGMLHTSDGISVGSYVSSIGGAIGTKTNHPFSLFANNSTAALTVKTNADVEVSQGFYAASTGGLNMVPLGAIRVSYFLDGNANLQYLVIANKAGNLALGTFTHQPSLGYDDRSTVSVKLNVSLLSGYSDIILVGTPNFDHINSDYINVAKANYRYTNPDAFLDITIGSDSFYNLYISGDYIIYGIK